VPAGEFDQPGTAATVGPRKRSKQNVLELPGRYRQAARVSAPPTRRHRCRCRPVAKGHNRTLTD
jgi:hypothetical protein